MGNKIQYCSPSIQLSWRKFKRAHRHIFCQATTRKCVITYHMVFVTVPQTHSSRSDILLLATPPYIFLLWYKRFEWDGVDVVHCLGVCIVQLCMWNFWVLCINHTPAWTYIEIFACSLALLSFVFFFCSRLCSLDEFCPLGVYVFCFVGVQVTCTG